MLAPRSANAKHSSIPGNSQGIRNLPGSPSFLGNLFKMTAEQCSFIEVRARQGSLEVRATSLDLRLFSLSRLEGYGRETEGLVFGTGATTGATMGSKTGVVIGSGPTGGWTGAVLCEQEGCTWSFVTSGIGFTTEEVGIGGGWSGAEDWLFLSKSNARTIYLKSTTSDETALGGKEIVPKFEYDRLGGILFPAYSAAPRIREWKKLKLNRSNWNFGDPHCGGDLVEVNGYGMGSSCVMTEELFVLDKIDLPCFSSNIVCHNLGIRIGPRTLGGCLEQIEP
ncbi:hypothetical protein Tco_0374040 [Tanacetum coccineum]